MKMLNAIGSIDLSRLVRATVCAILLLVVTVVPSHARPLGSESLTLKPDEDAYISQRFPAINYDNAPAWPVEVDAQDRERYPLLRFDTSSIHPDSQVISAELELWLEQGDGEPLVDIIVQRITLGWDETSVTWNKRPPMQGTWGRDTVGTSPGWRDWDLRVLTQNWVRESMPNHGIVLRGPAGTEFERLFESSGSREPRLVVVFEPPTPTPTDVPTQTASPSSTPTEPPTPTPSATLTQTPTHTPSPTASNTATSTLTPTTTSSPTMMPTSSPTLAPSPSATTTMIATARPSTAPSFTATPTIEASPTPSATSSSGASSTPGVRFTPTPTLPGGGSHTPATPLPDAFLLYLPSLGLTIEAVEVSP